MPIIKPISDLRNKSKAMSELVHKSREPVFITKDGEGDMVLMSLAQYGEIQRKLEVYAKLSAATAQAASGAKPRDLGAVMREVRKRIGDAR